MQFSVRSGLHSYQVTLLPGEERAIVNGKTVTFERREGHLLLGSRSIEFSLVKDQAGILAAVVLGGKVIPVAPLLPEAKSGGRASAQGSASGARGGVPRSGDSGEVQAPLNGQVVKVNCQEGEEVKEGQVILVLEAMKMENEVTSPFHGILKSVEVEVGQIVTAHQILFTLTLL